MLDYLEPVVAKQMVAKNLLDTNTFDAPYGIRSLSRLEKMYDVRATSNPSNWLGPIWVNANFPAGVRDGQIQAQARAHGIAEQEVIDKIMLQPRVRSSMMIRRDFIVLTAVPEASHRSARL